MGFRYYTCFQEVMQGEEFRLLNHMWRITLIHSALYSAANDPQTGNDPQIGPQMIPNRKWSPMWTANDPAGKQRMARILVSWIFFLIGDVYFLLVWRWLLD